MGSSSSVQCMRKKPARQLNRKQDFAVVNEIWGVIANSQCPSFRLLKDDANSDFAFATAKDWFQSIYFNKLLETYPVSLIFLLPAVNNRVVQILPYAALWRWFYLSCSLIEI